MTVYEVVNLVALQHGRLSGSEFCVRYKIDVSEVINSVASGA